MRLMPGHLNARLILLVTCILLVTGATSGWLTARRQSDRLLATMRENSTVMARSVSDNAAHHLVLRDYAGLEFFLLRSADVPDIVRLQVCEPDGAVIGDVEHLPGMSPRALPGIKHITPPPQTSGLIAVEGGAMVIWEPIEAGTLLGWVRATYSMDNIRDAQEATLKNSLLLALFWVACSAVLLLLMLRPTVQAIGRLTSFARRLDERKGDQMDAAHRVVEIEELGASLNYASRKLFSTEQQLIHERERLRVTLRSIHDGVIAADARGAVVFMNRSSEDLTGWSADEAAGQQAGAVFRLQASPSGDSASGLFETVLNAGAAAGLDPEAVLVSKDGTKRPIAGSMAPILDEGGNMSGMVIVFRDVSLHKKAEKRLALLNFALNNVRDEAYLINEQASFEYVNDEACRIMGYGHEELLGLSVADVDPGFPPERWPEHWRDLRERGAITFEGQHRTRAGQAYPVEISANYFEYDGQGYNLALVRDITKRKQAEETLRERESFISNILDSVDEGFIVVDRQYRIVSANRAFCGMMKSAGELIVGRPCYEVSHHAARPCFESGVDCAVRRTFETGGAHFASHTHIDATGTKQFVELKSYPITDASGNVVSAIETVNDITEKKKLEEQLRHAQKLEALGTLAGGVAHDFNNILGVIVGYGEIMKLHLPKKDPNMAYLTQICEAADRAAQLTQALLLFSRKQQAVLKPIGVNDLVNGMKKMVLRVIGEDIETNVVLTPEKLTVMGDSGQLEQVLLNLATNARDAMPEGGVFTIETRHVEIDDKFIHLQGFGKPGKYALIIASDTGKGMDEETRERIFEPFYTTKEAGKGTGLGLAIVYGIVNQHNGFINCSSKQGKGTTFEVYLPLIREVLVTREADDTAAAPGGTETILIADDDPDIRKMTKEVLEMYGYSVIEAGDGAEAVRKYLENRDRINLALLDVVMPRKSGKDAYEEIRAEVPGVRVLFCSGYSEDVIQRKRVIAEGLTLIQKPVKPRELLVKIREILDMNPAK